MDIRLPNITGENDTQKLSQMQSYLYQLVEQLNYSLATLNGETKSENLVASNSAGNLEKTEDEKSLDNFNSIKALIINSADIVSAYYDAIKTKLDGVYVAESDFGKFAEQTSQDIEANSTSLKQTFEDMQMILSDLQEIQSTIIDTNAWIKSGLLGNDSEGVPIYGLEVGQKSVVDGEEVFNKYARFTANGIYFYLPSVNEAVAWMSGEKLYISNAEIKGQLIIGGYYFDTSNGLALKWVGGN